MARDSKPRPFVSPLPRGGADLLLLLWREMEVPDAPLPKIHKVTGLAAVVVVSLLCEEGKELTAALPPVAHTYFPDGGARTTRPRC